MGYLEEKDRRNRALLRALGLVQDRAQPVESEGETRSTSTAAHGSQRRCQVTRSRNTTNCSMSC